MNHQNIQGGIIWAGWALNVILRLQLLGSSPGTGLHSEIIIYNIYYNIYLLKGNAVTQYSFIQKPSMFVVEK